MKPITTGLVNIKKECLKLIEDHFEYASSLSIALIRSEAKKILAQRSELNEFVMANGTFFFISNDIIDEEELNEPEFYEMVWELNDKFNCTGFPMRIKLMNDGSFHEINDW